MSFELRDPLGNKFVISGSFKTLGRSADNDIVIRDNAISRHHLNFFIKEGRLIVEDAGSQNGFLVNGEQASEAMELRKGDQLSFGRQVYVVVPLGHKEKVNFKDIPKPRPKEGAKPHTQSIEIKNIPGGANRRYLIYGLLALFLGYLFMADDAPELNNEEAKTKLETALAPLPTEGYTEEEPQKKTPNQLMADSRLREAIRDYFNDNYSRAISGFQGALTLDPSNEEARSYLQRAEVQLKFQLEDLVFHADKAFRIGHFQRARAYSVQALNILTERTPGYIRKIAQKNLGIEDNTIRPNQESNLLLLPCEQTQQPDLCSKALEVLKRSRTHLGEENTLK